MGVTEEEKPAPGSASAGPYIQQTLDAPGEEEEEEEEERPLARVPVTNEKEIQDEAEDMKEVADIRNDMKLPNFLQAMPEAVGNDSDDKTTLETMQAMKAREQESVRWRSVQGHVNDGRLLAELEDMRNLAYAKLGTTLADLEMLFARSCQRRERRSIH